MTRIIETTVHQLPDTEQDAHTAVSVEAIAVRVGAQACVAHQRWMTREQVQATADVLVRLLDRWPA